MKRFKSRKATNIKQLASIVMSKKAKYLDYRKVQNSIINSETGKIVYMPPEAKEVPDLMGSLLKWVNNSINLPPPIVAGILHYQFETIHPFIDGNGRTGRLLVTLLLNQRGYGLNGFYSLEEYYFKNLLGYYKALENSTHHNYYFGKNKADITSWLEFFLQGMYDSFLKVQENALLVANKSINELSNTKEAEDNLRNLDAKQKEFLSVFKKQNIVTTKDICDYFNINNRQANFLCKKWIKVGYLQISDRSKKSRSYKIGNLYKDIF